MKIMRQNIRRGDIFLAELSGKGSQQTGVRPVIVYSNNTNNMFSPTLNVIPLSAELKSLCVHVLIEGCGLREPSMALLEQITTINKTQVRQKIGKLTLDHMREIDRAADIQLGRNKKESRAEDPFRVA